MLNRKFTLRESILLVLAAVVGLAIFYYQVVYKSIEAQLASYSVEDLESEVMIYQAKLARQKTMQEYIESHRGETLGEIALYNNLANEINELGTILDGVEELSVSMSEPTLLDTTVRRNANISFKTYGYTRVMNLIRALYNSTYRCLISDISVSAQRDNVLDENAEINVNVRMTFYERVDETTNLDGLTILNS